MPPPVAVKLAPAKALAAKSLPPKAAVPAKPAVAEKVSKPVKAVLVKTAKLVKPAAKPPAKPVAKTNASKHKKNKKK